MLTYLATAEALDTTETFLSTWGAALSADIIVRSYDELPAMRTLPAGAYVFSDLERLTDEGLYLADRLWARLASAAPGSPLLNRPRRHLRRRTLLARLHATGVNSFRAFPVSAYPRDLRFPVFLRYEHEHWGPMTDLLHDRRRLTRALRRARILGHREQDLIVVEFCDTIDGEGFYRKYGAYLVNGEVLPRHILFTRHWAPRHPGAMDARMLREEQTYLEANPHEAQLRDVAALAGVDYGRIDYGIDTEGALQVWEINTNPALMHASPDEASERYANQLHFADRISAALGHLAAADGRGDVVVGDLWDGRPWPSRSASLRARRVRLATFGRRRSSRGQHSGRRDVDARGIASTS